MSKYSNSIFALVLGFVVILVFVVFTITRQTPTPDESQPISSPVDSKLTLKQGTGRPRLVDLGATECVACKKLAPILEELRTEYAGRMDVDFIDVWKAANQDQAMAYGIQQIPTQIFLDPNGRELWRHVGFLSKEDILAKWKEFGFDLNPR